MTIKINASAIAQARDYAANYDQDDFQQEKARLRRDLLAHFSPSELEQVPYNTLVSHIFNADWLTTDPNNWFEAPPFKRRIGLVDISIAKKDAINDYDEAKKRHAKFLRQLRFQSLFSFGEKRAQAKKLQARYKAFILKQRQLFLENLRKQLAESVQAELATLGGYAKNERDQIVYELMFLATRTQEKHLQDTYSALEMHERLTLLQQKINHLADKTAEVDSPAAARLREKAVNFITISNRYTDNCLASPINPPKYKTLADVFIFICTALGVIGLVLSLTTPYGALAYLGLFGTFMLGREIYYLSRDLYYGRAPTRRTIAGLIWGGLLITGGIFTPVLANTTGFIIDTYHLMSDLSYFATFAIKSVSLLFHASIFTKLSVATTAVGAAFTAGLATAWAARHINKASKSAELGASISKREDSSLSNASLSSKSSDSLPKPTVANAPEPEAKAKGKLVFFSVANGSFNESNSYLKNIAETQLYWYRLHSEKGKNVVILRQQIEAINEALREYHADYTYRVEKKMRMGDLQEFNGRLNKISTSLSDLIQAKDTAINANPRIKKQAVELQTQIKAEIAVLNDLYHSDECASVHYMQDIGTKTKRRFDF